MDIWGLWATGCSFPAVINVVVVLEILLKNLRCTNCSFNFVQERNHTLQAVEMSELSSLIMHHDLNSEVAYLCFTLYPRNLFCCCAF
jgi:hypothetical protein